MADYSRHSTRYIRNDYIAGKHVTSLQSINGENIPFDPHAQLLQQLKDLLTSYPPTQEPREGYTFSGLYSGVTSIAYLFLRLSTVYPELKIHDKLLLFWARQYMGIQRPGRKMRRTGPAHCGVGDEGLCWAAVNACITRDKADVEKVCAYEEEINNAGDEQSSNEWLYGRAGYLYLLRMVKYFLNGSSVVSPPLTNDQLNSMIALLDSAISKTSNRIMRSRQPWEWHSKTYYGAAHGTIGIVTQLLLSGHTSSSALATLLTSLLKTQLPSGNFPSSANHPEKDSLVQFCHGAPGFIISLYSILPFYNREQSEPHELSQTITDAIQKSRPTLSRRGILKKEPCICHGTSGNAIALTACGADTMQEVDWFLQYTTVTAVARNLERGVYEGSEERKGLFTGQAGRVWAWAVRDKAEDGLAGKVLGYNDL